MRIIDFHAHAYPRKLADSVVALFKRNTNYIMNSDGTLEGTIEFEKKLGTDAFVLLHIASKPEHESNVNDFAIKCNGDGIYSFGSVHPYSKKIRYELERLKEHGILGVKFHNEFQGYDMDDKEAYPMYEMCANMGFIMFFHGGFDPHFADSKRARPARAGKITRDFAGTPMVFAHLGDVNDEGETLEHLCGKNVYLDTSMIHEHMDKQHAKNVILAHGTDRILFGTDVPVGGADSIDYLKSLGLKHSDYEKIFYENAQNLLGLGALPR